MGFALLVFVYFLQIFLLQNRSFGCLCLVVLRITLDFAPFGTFLQIFFADIRLMEVGWLFLVVFDLLLVARSLLM